MGYRSQVAIAFNKKAFYKHVGSAIKDFKDCDQILQTDDTVTFIWEDVKWYSDYDDVKSVMSVIERIGCSEDYGFLRVGEEAGDIENIGSPFDFELNTSTCLSTGNAGEEIEHKEFFALNSIKFIKDA